MYVLRKLTNKAAVQLAGENVMYTY